MNKVVVRVSTLANLCLLSLIILITLGAYLQINNFVIIFYLTLSLCFFLSNPTRVLSGLRKKHYYLWLFYLLITFVSTLMNNGDFKSFLSSLSLFVIIHVFVQFGDRNTFMILFRNTIFLLAILGVLSFFLKKDLFFETLKNGTPYLTLDLSIGGGISSLFEFRHYFACYLISAIYFHLIIPYHKKSLHYIIGGILVLAILLTYTRSILISIFFIFMFIVFSKRRFTSNEYLLFFLVSMILICMGAISFLFFDGIVNTLVGRFIDIFAGDGDFGGVRGYTLTKGVAYMFSNVPHLLLLGGGGDFALQWLEENPFYYWSFAIDNQYVTTFMDYGLLGLFVLLVLMKHIFRVISLGMRERRFPIFALCLATLGLSMFFFEIFGTTSSILVLWTICLCSVEEIGKEFN